MIKVLVIPRDSNPYQSLLYGAMIKVVSVKFLEGKTKSKTLNLLIYPFTIINSRLKGYKIIHIHWLWDFVFPIPGLSGKVASTLYCNVILLLIKILKYKIVWTVHNILPHDTLFINDLKIVKFIADLSDVKIVHSKNTINLLKKLKINTNNCKIIPHGNYIDYYKNKISKDESRKLLKINKNDFIFLFFGKIKSYKGLTNLLLFFNKLTLKKKNIRLLIVGEPHNEKLVHIISKYQKSLGNKMITLLRHITDNDIQIYMNASNIAVLPFESIITSGSIILNLSYKLPILAPRKGDLNDLPADVGIFYTEHKDGLYLGLEQALKRRKELFSLGLNGYNYISQFSWNIIAKETVFVFNNLDKKV